MHCTTSVCRQVTARSLPSTNPPSAPGKAGWGAFQTVLAQPACHVCCVWLSMTKHHSSSLHAATIILLFMHASVWCCHSHSCSHTTRLGTGSTQTPKESPVTTGLPAASNRQVLLTKLNRQPSASCSNPQHEQQAEPLEQQQAEPASRQQHAEIIVAP